MKKVLISVVGPTAIGKTKLAIALAQHFKTDILSADSRQFYKEMRIGTAVPSAIEQQQAKHHFIQHLSIAEPYSVGQFEKDALNILDTLFKKKDCVVLVGGSGLYVDAVTKGLDDFPKIDPRIRHELSKELAEKGIESLQLRLKELDPEYYSRVDIENPHRLIRALEVGLGTGRPYSSFIKAKRPERPFEVCTLVLSAERETVYQRIEQRVDQMMAEGLLQEAKALYPHRALNALQTVGYKELFTHFDGEWDLDFAVSEIKKNTRRFAKRQLTWFRKSEDALWVDYKDELSTVIAQVQKKIALRK